MLLVTYYTQNYSGSNSYKHKRKAPSDNYPAPEQSKGATKDLRVIIP